MRKFLGLLLLLVYLPAYAFNLGFLQYSPAYYFSKTDWKIMEKAATNALNHSADNVKTEWKNPASGAFGSITPSATTNENNRTCRQLKMFNNAGHISGETNYLCCKINGEWKIVS